MAAHVESRVLDLGLDVLTDECTHIEACSQEPTTYAEASSGFMLGYKNWGAGNAFAAPEAVNPVEAVLLLQCNGEQDSQNFVDVTGRHSVIPYGAAKIDTSIKKFGSGAGHFVANPDCLLIRGNEYDFVLGNLDFTLDFWFYKQGHGSIGQTTIIFDWGNGGVYYPPTPYMSYLEGWGLIIDDGFKCYIGQEEPTQQWFHVALTRADNTFRTFWGGQQKGSSYTSETSLQVKNNYPSIGDHRGTEDLNWYVDEFRLVKGQALWTANFTPPTEAADYHIHGGRKIKSIAITDGTTATSGTVNWLAATDHTNSRLLAVMACDPEVVTQGVPWAAAEFEITLPATEGD